MFMIKGQGLNAWSEWPYKTYSWRQNCTSECLSTSAMQRVPPKAQFGRWFILLQFKLGPNWLFFWFKLHCGPQGKEHKQLANLQPLNKIALTWGDSLNIAYDFFSPFLRTFPFHRGSEHEVWHTGCASSWSSHKTTTTPPPQQSSSRKSLMHWIPQSKYSLGPEMTNLR